MKLCGTRLLKFLSKDTEHSHHNNILGFLGTPKKICTRNAENESRGIFSKVKKMKRRRGRGEEKKKGGEKGEERKEGGKSLFLQGLYIISTYTVLF